MKTLLLSAATIALFSLPLSAQQFNTSIEGGLFLSDRGSSDSDDEIVDATPFGGVFIAGQYGRSLGNGLDLGVDLRYEAIGEDTEDIDDFGRIQTGVLGVHLGTEVAAGTYAGGFIGVGYFAAEDGDDTNTGYILGGEVLKDFGGMTGFAQLGYAVAEPDPDDNAFVGPVYRIGTAFELTPAIDMMVTYEGGTSPNIFEDDDDSGRFGFFTITGTYEINSGLEAIAAVSLDTYTANTEDEGTEANLYLGVRYTFGGGDASPLTTPMGAFKAVDWASELD